MKKKMTKKMVKNKREVRKKIWRGKRINRINKEKNNRRFFHKTLQLNRNRRIQTLIRE